MADHSILVGRLRSIGVSEGSLAWFANYLSQRVQCIKLEHLVSATAWLNPRPHAHLNLHEQHRSGSRKLSSIYMQIIVLHSAGPSPDFVLNALQQSFLSVQQAFSTLSLVLNTSKTKVMWFG
jgi:hypothetical protein